MHVYVCLPFFFANGLMSCDFIEFDDLFLILFQFIFPDFCRFIILS